METNIRGLVARMKLPSGKGMMPLFEAVSNSMDAIIDLGKSDGKISIELIPLRDLASSGEGDTAFVVDGFRISDSGIGLDAAHMAAFGEAYTLSKHTYGGKGVGRFSFLKVFGDVRVRSVFEESGQRFQRDFAFTIDKEVEGSDVVTPTDRPVGTSIEMKQMDPRYRQAWPVTTELVGKRVIEHFLIRFASRACPRIVVEAEGQEPRDLKSLFDASIAPHLEEQLFNINGHEFALQTFRHRDGRARHEYHLCATGREVASAKLKDLLPELPERFVDDEQTPYTLLVLVTGEYFDEHANQERTHIAFGSDDELKIDPAHVSRQALNRAIAETLRSALVTDMKTTHEEKFAQVVRFVEEEAPEYRVLTHERYRSLIEQRIEAGLSREQLDEALLRVRREIEDDVRKEKRHVAALMEKVSFEQYQERFKRLVEGLNDVNKSKLSDYVAHRRVILDLFGDSLKRLRADDKYPLEKVLHKMIFPMGVSSKDVFFEQQNLWVIDERLCFHSILTSDKKLKSIPGLEGTSGKEPDIFTFFYDTPIGVAEIDVDNSGAIVIIEFKRPGRDDYDKDPADQIIQRFVEIKEGNVKDVDGRPVNPERLRFTGYLIADLTPSLRRQVAMRYRKTVDNEGYFVSLPDGDGSVEIVSYDKLLRDAKRRNRILFDKLGVHKH